MKCFLYTNILCYAIDEKDKTKQLLVQKLLNSLLFRDTFVSTQVLQELYNVTTTKMKHLPETARNAVRFGHTLQCLASERKHNFFCD